MAKLNTQKTGDLQAAGLTLWTVGFLPVWCDIVRVFSHSLPAARAEATKIPLWPTQQQIQKKMDAAGLTLPALIALNYSIASEAKEGAARWACSCRGELTRSRPLAHTCCLLSALHGTKIRTEEKNRTAHPSPSARLGELRQWEAKV